MACGNIEVYPDTVQLVHDLAAAGKTLLVVSNNPYLGCCWKLKRCGLADEFGSHVFARILGTNILRGCKCEEGVWQRALCQIPDDPARICTVGDNPVEDGEIPRRYGVGNTILFDRKAILRGIDQKKNIRNIAIEHHESAGTTQEGFGSMVGESGRRHPGAAVGGVRRPACIALLRSGTAGDDAE